MTTDTPRTDAARERYYDGKTSDWVHFTISMMLERELAEKTNEVARLRELWEETQDGATMDEWYNGFSKIKSTEPAPEWRELGPDEVIGEGDEYNPASLGEWIKVPHGWIGETCSITKIRTRRPFPKQVPLFPPIHPKQVLTPEERTEQLKHNSEVARLKEMVIDASKRGDEMAAHWKERAEKAEAIIKQIHHYAGIVEGFKNANK